MGHANDAILADGGRVLIKDPIRFDGVQVSGWANADGGTPAVATSSSR